MLNNIKKVVILASGSGTNMENIIKSSQNGELKGVIEVVAVICNVEGVGAIKKAEALGVPAMLLPSKGKAREVFESALAEIILGFEPNFICLAGFMRVLTPLFVNKFQGKIINIHPADKDAYQGPKGYEWAFENKLTETYISVHYVDEGVDTGPLILKEKVLLYGVESVDDVKKRGLQVEYKAYVAAIKKICEVL